MESGCADLAILRTVSNKPSSVVAASAFFAASMNRSNWGFSSGLGADLRGMEHPLSRNGGGCQLVLIEWEDSTQPQGRWQGLSAVGVPKVVRCVSVGFLVRATRESKTLAPNLGNVDCDDDVQASGLISIPARAVLRIVKIEETSESLAAYTNCGAGISAPAAVPKHPGAATQPKRQARESLPRSSRRGA